MRAVDRSRSRRALDAVNVPLVLTVVGLAIYGTIVVDSATVATSTMVRHIVGIGLGVVAMFVMWFMDYRRYGGWIGALGTLCALLMIMPRIPGLGVTQSGAQSWVALFGYQIGQPSEPAKLVYIIVLAWVIAGFQGRVDAPGKVFKVLLFVGGAVGLIMLQPDLGTGLVFVATAAVMLIPGGMKAKYFVVGALVAALAIGVVVKFELLKDYQMKRLLVFVDHSLDPSGAGYNLEQSMIAIGSGGLTGKGLGAGTQSNLHFLPERHTDFIFAVLGEELGFTGGLLLLGLYLALLMAALAIATSSRDLFGSLIAAGVLGMWLFQILENIGMTIGIMPITGIPLPFISYGSSSMVTNLAAVGLLLSVWSRRYGTSG